MKVCKLDKNKVRHCHLGYRFVSPRTMSCKLQGKVHLQGDLNRNQNQEVNTVDTLHVTRVWTAATDSKAQGPNKTVSSQWVTSHFEILSLLSTTTGNNCGAPLPPFYNTAHSINLSYLLKSDTQMFVPAQPGIRMLAC